MAVNIVKAVDSGGTQYFPITHINAVRDSSGTTLNVLLEELGGGEVPSARTITTASGLTGGGDLSADRIIGLVATGTAGTYKTVVVDEYGRVTSGNSIMPSVLAGVGLSGGGNLSGDVTVNVALPTTYSAATYTTSPITSDEPIVYCLAKFASNLTNQVCPVSNLAEGQQCNVIYYNTGATGTSYTVSISTTYKSPTGGATTSPEVKLTVKGNGYGEVNYINLKGTIFVRGV
jgi:hypothetical protein